MARKCSHCGDTGHNSRTCSNVVQRAILPPPSAITSTGSSNGGLIRLFGVQLEYLSSNSTSSLLSSSSTASQSSSSSSSSSSSCMASNNNNMKKSFSLDSLSPPLISNSANKISSGYLSDIGRFQDKRKGVPWTEEEHRAFLLGLERLGKGDWRGISRNFVTTRTPTQVASHAQKYFLRRTCLDMKKKPRSSLFDSVWSRDSKRNQKPDFSSFLNRDVPSTVSSFGLQGPLNKLPMGKSKSGPSDDAGPDLELSLAAPSRPLQGINDSPAANAGSLAIYPIGII